jgi:hypothetical protein
VPVERLPFCDSIAAIKEKLQQMITRSVPTWNQLLRWLIQQLKCIKQLLVENNMLKKCRFPSSSTVSKENEAEVD